MVAAALSRDGYYVFANDDAVKAWADAAHEVAVQVLENDRTPRRHAGTWFVGVDAMPNLADGSVSGVPLVGTWRDHVTPPEIWHQAQLSVVYPGYPGRDPGESDAAVAYRRNKAAAHVDGLLPVGPNKRRFLREPHGFILGLPLTDVRQSPLVVWRGSQGIMGDAFRAALAENEDISSIDVTETYQAARRLVFECCERISVEAMPGQTVLMHRHLLHGVAPWDDNSVQTPRMVAYFRPIIAPQAWLSASDSQS